MLYLHIGTPKAGSTSIQNFLRDCSDDLPYAQLDRFGTPNSWRIAASTGTERSRRHWVKTRKLLQADEYQELKDGFWTEVKNEKAKIACSDFVASSEYIYVQVADDEEAMKRLQEQLVTIFGKVKILIYFRNQIDWVKSLYAQSVKGSKRDTSSFPAFVKSLENDGSPIHFDKRIEMWGKVFGWKNVDVGVFDRKNFPNGNLIEDFCDRIGIDYDAEKLGNFSQPANISPSYSHLAVLRHLNRLRLGKKRRVRRAVTRLVPEKDFPSKFDERLLSKVSEGNKWLNERYFYDLPVALPELKAFRL